jgi:Lrp/AsnC family leucine-responsive transcriptional regulator
MKELDDIDRRILQQLQEDARTTHSDLAARVGLSVPGLQKRLKKLEVAGVVQRYVATLDRRLLGFDVLCFIQVTLHRHEPRAVERFRALVQKMPEVLECFHITGTYDYILKVVVRNTAHLEEFLVDKLTKVPGMDRIQTSLVLSEVKTSSVLPVTGDR